VVVFKLSLVSLINHTKFPSQGLGTFDS